MRLDAPRRRRRLDRLGIALQVIERASLVREPGGKPQIARTESQAHLERFECFGVAAVEAQHDAAVEMPEREALVQLDRAAGTSWPCLDVATPVADLRENVLCIGVLAVELGRPQGRLTLASRTSGAKSSTEP